MNAHQVEVAAESLAASLMSHAGWDVLVRYGANLPEYDIVAIKGDQTLKISSKGSQDGGWGLTQSYKKCKSYDEAADIWLKKHSPSTAVFLVQFQGVELGVMPRVYIATPQEIADQLKRARLGHGQTILYEHYQYKKGIAAGCLDILPNSWLFCSRRLEHIVSRCCYAQTKAR